MTDEKPSSSPISSRAKRARDMPRRRGRKPSRDWDALFFKWLKSGLTRLEFLKNEKLSTSSGTVSVNTRHWEVRKAEWLARPPQNVERVEEVSNVVQIDRTAVVPEVMGRDVEEVHPAAQPAAWQIIQKWRQKQALEDVRMADSLRTQIKLILKGALVKVEKVDAAGQTQIEYKTSLKPHEVRALSNAAGDLQRIQRLALGLSTENIGVDDPRGASHVEPEGTQAVAGDEPIPIFAVEMSRRGKFMRSRPRRVK